MKCFTRKKKNGGQKKKKQLKTIQRLQIIGKEIQEQKHLHMKKSKRSKVKHCKITKMIKLNSKELLCLICFKK